MGEAEAGAGAGVRNGVIARTQALAAGVTSRQIARLLASGKWKRIFRGVYTVGGNPSWSQKVAAALLRAGPGAVASHSTAARLYGLDGFVPWPARNSRNAARDGEPIHVTGVGDHRSKEGGLRLHRPVAEPNTDDVQSLRTTDLVDTLIDLATLATPEELAFAVECAWRRDPFVPLKISYRLSELGGQGREGARKVRAALADCARRTRPMDSPLEVKIWRLLVLRGCPLPEVGVLCWDREGPLRFDFYYPKLGLIIEGDGYEVHGTRKAFIADARRNARIAAMGLRRLAIAWDDVTDPQALEATLRRIRAALTARPRRRLRTEFEEAEPVPNDVLGILRWTRFVERAEARRWAREHQRPPQWLPSG